MKIVWNDCDNYIELELAESRTGRKVIGNTLLGRCDRHTAIEVFPASWDEVPIDADGEPDFEGFYYTEAGNLYKGC